MYQLRKKFTNTLVFALATLFTGLGSVSAQTPAFPNPVVDDNGHYGFVREVVPLLLGRKPYGSREVKLLGDIAEISDRKTVLRLLMASDEFVNHWADTMLDVLRLQRADTSDSEKIVSLKHQRATCFEEPKLAQIAPALATFIATSNSSTLWSGSDFNMKDVALAAIKADRIDALQRAYLYPFTMNGGRDFNEEVYKSSQGEDFSHTYLNRNMRCFSCHNEQTSTSDDHTGWDRHWPIEIWSDKVLFGASAPSDAGKLNNIFRPDQAGNIDDANDNKLYPWGIDSTCTSDTYPHFGQSKRHGFIDVASSNSQDVEFAGEVGNNIAIKNIDEVLRQGIASLKSSGLLLAPGGQNAFPEPATAEQALAYTVAMSTVNAVWSKLMGENLTVTNYFSRNQSQRDALWNLTVETFIPNWSIKSLIETILLKTYTARKTPETSSQTDAYKLPMIINPWVARDPRQPNPPPITKLNTKNGQGEIVRAHTKRTAMQQASVALGVAEPSLFGITGRYSFDTQLELGQFMSTSQPGLDGFDIQSLLAWEDTNGLCQGSPWMNKLVTKITEYDSQHPLLPLTLIDVIQTMRDWLLQDAHVEVSGTLVPESHELAALGAVFSVNPNQTLAMNTPAATYSQLVGADTLRTKLNEVCGAYISSPQFLMTGISKSQPMEIPDFMVCHGEDDSCTYEMMCEDYKETLSTQLSTYISCNDNGVVPEDPPDNDPPIISMCQYHPLLCEDNFIPTCFEDLFGLVNGGTPNCPIDVERCDPRCGLDRGFGFDGERFGLGLGDGFGFPGGGELGLRCCGGNPDFNRRLPDSIISWIEDALILEVQGVDIINLYNQDPRVLKQGEKLKFGDVISMPPGSRMIMQVNGEKIDVGGKRGVPSVFARTNSQRFNKALTEVSKSGDNRLIRKMLKDGLSPDSIMPNGESLLTWSIRRGDSRLTNEFIKAGADINSADGRGNTPIIAAQHFGQDRIRSMLFKSGALPIERERKFQKQALTHKIMVTGPSAVKAPHPAGEKYFTEVQWRGLDVKPRIPSIDESKKRILYAREIQRKRGEAARKNEPDNQGYITEFPKSDRASVVDY